MQPSTFTCSRCSAVLPPGALLCPNCGLPFAGPVPAGSNPGYQPSPAYRSPGKSTSAIVIIAIVGAVGCLPFIAIVAAILFPVFFAARSHAQEAVSMSNLRQLGLGVLQYENDHGNRFPPMDSMDHFKTALGPYLNSAQIGTLTIEPGANVPYILNPTLSGTNAANLSNPSATVIIQEAVPHRGTWIGKLYADGHVRMQQLQLSTPPPPQ